MTENTIKRILGWVLLLGGSTYFFCKMMEAAALLCLVVGILLIYRAQHPLSE